MKKISVSTKRQSREYMANPHANSSLKARQKKSKWVSYKESAIIDNIGNGYCIIRKKRG